MVITAPSELDVIAHRLDRIGRDCIRVEAIVAGTLNATEHYRNRVITHLMEEKMLLSAHTPEHPRRCRRRVNTEEKSTAES